MAAVDRSDLSCDRFSTILPSFLAASSLLARATTVNTINTCKPCSRVTVEKTWLRTYGTRKVVIYYYYCGKTIGFFLLSRMTNYAHTSYVSCVHKYVYVLVSIRLLPCTYFEVGIHGGDCVLRLLLGDADVGVGYRGDV